VGFIQVNPYFCMTVGEPKIFIKSHDPKEKLATGIPLFPRFQFPRFLI
jgi:hypothetical protein